MDNATHAIAGLLVAQAVIVARGRAGQALTPGQAPSRAFVVAASIVSAVANNFPDLDFVYAGITPGKLGYLLHHRGHTHTVVAGLAASALIFAAVLPFRRRFSRPDLRWLGGLAVFGPLLHITMDASNNYGVHPFWPFDNRWFYGDAIFIIEPWYWVFAVPSLVFSSRNIILRALLALVLLTGLGLAWAIDFVSWAVALVLTLASLATTVWALRLGALGRVLLGTGGCIAVTLVFVLTSRAALARISIPEASAGGTRVDTVLTPGPGNPLCFNAIAVDTVAGRYRLRLATVAAFPFVPVELCRVDGWLSNLSMTPTKLELPGVRFLFEWSAPLDDLIELNRTNCDVAAFLRFARAPYWLTSPPDSIYAGDLRYDRGLDEGFAELRAPSKPAQCPSWIPPWIAPRAEVLSRAQTSSPSGQTQP